MKPASLVSQAEPSGVLIAAARHAVDPALAIHRHVSCTDNVLTIDDATYDLTTIDKFILIAVGKASVPMATAMCEVVGERLTAGVVVTKYGHVGNASAQLRQNGLTVHESAHPVPDQNSVVAGDLVCDAIKDCTESSLVLACISGGASALMIAPIPGVRLQTMQAINDALLKSGADIREMNIVRSQLDRLKAGGLVRQSAPGQVVGLIVSDVIGDSLDVIASGLTFAPEARNVLVANNTQACHAVAACAEDLGYSARVVTTELRGEARVSGAEIANEISTAPPGTCLIYGGETTVTIHGDGKGGRNQELALAAAIAMQKHSWIGVSVIAFGTDGTDGPTDAAGAIARANTCQRAIVRGLSAEQYLERNDSYHFFQALDDLILTGPTGTNVADVVIALRERVE